MTRLHELALAVVANSARREDAVELARLVLERDRAERLDDVNHAEDCNWSLFRSDCDCWGDHAP